MHHPPTHPPTHPLNLPHALPADAIELDYALVEDSGWGAGIGMTPGRMTPGRSPHNYCASPSQLASPAGMSPFTDNIMFSPMGADGIMFSPGPATSPGYSPTSPGYSPTSPGYSPTSPGYRWVGCQRRAAIPSQARHGVHTHSAPASLAASCPPQLIFPLPPPCVPPCSPTSPAYR